MVCFCVLLVDFVFLCAFVCFCLILCDLRFCVLFPAILFGFVVVLCDIACEFVRSLVILCDLVCFRVISYYFVCFSVVSCDFAVILL